MVDALLQFEPAVLVSFLLAGLLLNITPGADFLLVTSSAITSGAKIGRAAAVGINLGVMLHILLAALGLSAILLAYPAAYTALLVVGAGYLLFMAYRAWQDDSTPQEGVAALSQYDAVKRGFLTNVLNPKTALFVFAFIPQFTNPESGPVWQQVLLLGLLFLINGFIFSLLLATASGSLARVLSRHIRVLRKMTAICFCILAVRLLIV